MHGDVKAGNVLIDDAGKACLTDFGLAFKYQKATTSNGGNCPVGTLRFMAPETIRKGTRTYATDVYAFGMLIYEAFTQEPPFLTAPDADVESGKAILARPYSDEIVSRGLTDGMWELLESCSSPKPANRPSCKEISISLAEMTRANAWNPLTPLLSIENAEGTSSPHLQGLGSPNCAEFLSVPKAHSDGLSTSRKSAMAQQDITAVRAFCSTTRDGARIVLRNDGCLVVTGQGETELCYPENARYVSSMSETGQSFTAEVTYGNMTKLHKWEISGTTIKHTGALSYSEWRFGEEELVLQWFDLLLQHALRTRTGSQNHVIGESREAIIEWKIVKQQWRRAIKGVREYAPVILSELNKAPPPHKWEPCTGPPYHIARKPTQTPVDLASYTVYKNGARHLIRTLRINGLSVEKTSAYEDDPGPFKVEEDQFSDARIARTWFTLMKMEYDDEVDETDKSSLRLHGLDRRPSASRGHSPSRSISFKPSHSSGHHSLANTPSSYGSRHIPLPT